MRNIIAIVGAIGSGKDTAGHHISQKLNRPVSTISDILRSCAKDRGLPLDRQTLIALSYTLAKENGIQFLGERLLMETSGDIIVTGIRIPEVIDYLRQNSVLTVLAVTASPDTRYERSYKRGVDGDQISFEEFLTNEQKENSVPNPQRVFELVEQADYVIENNSTLKVFLYEVNVFVKSLK